MDGRPNRRNTKAGISNSSGLECRIGAESYDWANWFASYLQEEFIKMT